MNMAVESQQKQTESVVGRRRATTTTNKRPEMKRPFAMASTYESRKPQSQKQESAPVNTIGNERFQNLLSMFSGNKENTKPENKDDKSVPSTGLSIKDRMNNYLQSKQGSEKQKEPTFDPILKQRYQNNEAEEEIDETNEDLELSEDEEAVEVEDKEDREEEL